MSERSRASLLKAGSRSEADTVLARPHRDRTHHLGRVLVSHFYMVAKTAGMFEFTNVITHDAVRTFMGTLRELLALDAQACLQMSSDCLFVNETRLKIDFEGFASFKFVIEAMKDRDIGSINFGSDVTDEDLQAFLRLFIEHDGRAEHEDTRKRISEGLQAANIGSIWVEEIRDLADRPTTSDVSDDYREVSINTYLKSIFVAKRFMEDFRATGSAHFQKARRLVHSVVDIVAQDETTILALTQIKNFDDYLFTHSANVCMLSIALGQHLGLGKAMLASLGLAGLLHDIGMVAIPHEILARRGSLSREERSVYEMHPMAGTKLILRNQGISEVSIRCARAAFEHHLNADHSGFPVLRENRPLTLIGRIVAIVDFYDSITTPDLDDGPCLSQEEALRLMAHEGKDIFDPLLVKVFLNTIGTYPLGTVVRLDTGEVGIVHRRNPDFSQMFRPLIKLISDRAGISLPPPHEIVDLSEWDAERNRYKRSIVETTPTSDFFDEIHEFTNLL